VGQIADFLLGRDLDSLGAAPNRAARGESRSLAPTASRESFDFAPVSSTSLPTVTQTAALRIADVYAACRVLADGVASLPPRLYRDTGNGRVAAGDDQRLATLLRRPSPGSTSADLFSHVMVGLLLDGNAFVGKFRSEGSIVQLGCLDSQSVVVEQQGARVVYLYSGQEGMQELSTADVVHVKAMSSDGIRGMSPVRQAMSVLQLNQALIRYLSSWLGNDSRPGGILSISDGTDPFATATADPAEIKRDAEELYGWRSEPPGHGRVAVFKGELSYEAVDPPLREQEFIAQRELSAREVARVMRVPAHMIDAATGDSMTYANTQQQARAFLDFSLRPWLVRIEQAFTNDPDLCPGGAYLSFDTDALVRMDPDGRAAFYKAGIEGGWLTIDEIRAREDLPPIGASS